MACIVKRPGGYYVKFRMDGKQKWKKAGARKKYADRLKTEIERELQQGTYQEMPDITFKELAGKWLGIKKADVRLKTYWTYEEHVRLRLVPYFGNRKVKSVSQEMIDNFRSELLERTDLSPETKKKCLTCLKAIFEKGIEWRYLPRNPAQFIKNPKASRREMEYLSESEVKALIDATDERYRCLIMFACLTGCRQGEILGLRWADIDFASGKVYVRQTLQLGSFYEPKTEKSKRVVIIPPILVDALKVHQARQAVELESNDHDLVFPNLTGKPMHGRNLTQRVLEPALKRAGIRKVGFHALRHSYVSMLVNAGENIKFISKQVGHSSAQITWDIYSHLFPETEKEAVNRLQYRLFGGEGKIKETETERT